MLGEGWTVCKKGTSGMDSGEGLTSVGLFESFGTLLGFLQNRKSVQTLSFVLFKF